MEAWRCSHSSLGEARRARPMSSLAWCVCLRARAFMRACVCVCARVSVCVCVCVCVDFAHARLKERTGACDRIGTEGRPLRAAWRHGMAWLPCRQGLAALASMPHRGTAWPACRTFSGWRSPSRSSSA